MKNKIKSNKKLKIAIITLGVLWTIALLLITLQAYLMSNKLWTIPIGLVVSALIFYLHLLLYKKLIKKSKIATLIFIVYITVHFIPLILQLIGYKSPAIDNVLIALIGLLLIYVWRD